MRRLFTALAALIVLAAQAAVADETIDFGGASIVVPDPQGFTLVTPDMTRVVDFLDRMAPPEHTRYLAYIPEDLAPGARENRIQNYLRVVAVQDIAGVGERSLTRAQFDSVRESIRSQNAEILRTVTARSGDEGGDLDVADALRFTNYVPLPMHAETADAAAYSYYSRTMENLSGARAGFFDTAVTMTMIHTRSRAILLNVGAPSDDLEWSRAFSKEWADAIIAANVVD